MYSRGRKPDWDADDGTRRTANKMINGLHVQTVIILGSLYWQTSIAINSYLLLAYAN